MSLNLDCHLNWNVTQIGMSLKLECHLIWNVTQILMSLKLEFHSRGGLHPVVSHKSVYGNQEIRQLEL